MVSVVVCLGRVWSEEESESESQLRDDAGEQGKGEGKSGGLQQKSLEPRVEYRARGDARVEDIERSEGGKNGGREAADVDLLVEG